MIDTETLKHLPDEYKARLVAFEEMFRTPGFKQLMDWAKATAEEKKARTLLARNWDEYVFSRAEWSTFEDFTRIEEATYQEFETIALAAREQQIEEVELEYE